MLQAKKKQYLPTKQVTWYVQSTPMQDTSMNPKPTVELEATSIFQLTKNPSQQWSHPQHCPNDAVMSSAAEAELGALFIDSKEAVYVRNVLKQMGHPQEQTSIQTDNCDGHEILLVVMLRSAKPIPFFFGDQAETLLTTG